VWVYRIYDTVTDPEGFIREWLDEHGSLLGEEEFAGESHMRVQCYLTTQEPEYDADPRYHTLELDVVDGVILAGYSAQPVVRAGEQLPVTLQWQAGGDGAVYGVRLGLASKGAGPEDWIEVAASTTSVLDETSPSQEVVIEIPSGTPPLEYSLIIYLYDASAGGVPDILAAGLEIGTIRVVKPLVPPPTPPLPHEPWANFGDLLQLTGYDLPTLEVEPGTEIDLQLFWRAWGVPLPLVRTEMAWRDSEGRPIGGETACLASRYRSTVWEREELVRDLCQVEVPEAISPGNYELIMRLEAFGPTGRREAIPFWSDAGVWEDSFALGALEVIDSQRP
jgi:hypothetical protein